MKVYLALGRGRPGFTQDFTCLELLKDQTVADWISLTGLSPSLAPLSSGFCYPLYSRMSALQPPAPLWYWVWAVPFSLAATWGITIVLFSCAYLDVSVRRVPFLNLFIQLDR